MVLLNFCAFFISHGAVARLNPIGQEVCSDFHITVQSFLFLAQQTCTQLRKEKKTCACSQEIIECYV